MKLMKHKTTEYKGKPYYRWAVLIPSETVKELGWEAGIELELIVRNGRLTLRKRNTRKT